MATAHDAGEHRGVPYLVMGYIEGLSLSQIAHSGGRLPVHQAINCILHVARGLGHAHRRGLVHRGVNPGTVLIDREGRVRLVGLKAARLTEDTGSMDRRLRERYPLTRVEAEYMAPELIKDPNLADPRSDVYSLGCLLYRAVTGVPPFRADTPARTCAEHRRRPIPKLSDRLARVPEGVQEVLVGMLAKSPDDRYQSLPAVISDLLTILPSAPAHRLLMDATRIVSGVGESGTRAKRENRPVPAGGPRSAASHTSRQGPIPIAQPRGS
jgi:serine/threonine protein kinase